MIANQLILDVHNELIIDNFAGGGGASTGIELALGRHVDIAINHDPEAVAMHTANHPQTRHYCESVWEVDPLEVTQGRPVGLVWLSPDCKHFSKAKGGKPVEKKIRGLAWVALRWAAKVKPRLIMLENVEEFVTWGPLAEGPDGKMYPCPKRKGRDFNAFCNALRKHGYAVEHRELRASDYGTPTIRKRLFLIARRDGQPIVWPEPTHGDPMGQTVKKRKLKPWRTAAECIDWSIPCPSIFERNKPLADATCRRIAKGIMRYVINTATPFIVNTRNGERIGQAPRIRDIDQPFWTITAQGSQHAIVAPVLTEHANASTPRCMPAGEHHALVSAFLARHYGDKGQRPGIDMREPLTTITATDHHSLVTSHIAKFRGENIGSGSDEPLHTVTTKHRYGLAGEQYSITDIGLRMLSPRELYRAQGFPDTYIIGDNHEQGLELTKSAQVRMCGNSVCPPLAAALVRANVADIAINRRVA